MHKTKEIKERQQLLMQQETRITELKEEISDQKIPEQLHLLAVLFAQITEEYYLNHKKLKKMVY